MLPPKVQRGESITAAWLNAAVAALFKCLRTGPGLALRQIGAAQYVLELTDGYRRGRGSGGVAEVTAADRAGLEALTLTEGDFCRTTGTLKRAYRYLDDLLICYTHYESS